MVACGDAFRSPMKWLERFVRKFRRSRMRKPTERELHDAIRLSYLFKDVPPANIDQLLSQSAVLGAAEGARIIQAGEEGDYYYVIVDGMAMVQRQRPGDSAPKVVAVLSPGYSFGEEALISNSKRNATVVMETDGILLRIPKAAFLDYIMTSLVTWVLPSEAQKKITTGARWLDVRDETDYRMSHLPNAISFPVGEIHEHLDALDKASSYVCYCANGRQSAAVAFILRQHGYDISVLQGGLKAIERQEGRRPPTQWKARG